MTAEQLGHSIPVRQQQQVVEQKMKQLLEERGVKVIEDGNFLYNKYLEEKKKSPTSTQEEIIDKAVSKIVY